MLQALRTRPVLVIACAVAVAGLLLLGQPGRAQAQVLQEERDNARG